MINGARRAGPNVRVVTAALSLGALVAGCASDNTPTAPSPKSTAASTSTSSPSPSSVESPVETPQPSTAATTAASVSAPTLAATSTVPFVPTNADPGQFDPVPFATAAPVDNPWLPLVPGYQATKEGAVNKGSRRLPHRRVVTVTDVTKEIAGVRDGARAGSGLRRRGAGGAGASTTWPRTARATSGTCGSYTEAYEGGQFVNANDAWLDGVNGRQGRRADDGRPADRTRPTYAQATVPGEGTAKAKVVKTGREGVRPLQLLRAVCWSSRRGGPRTRTSRAGVGGIKLQPKSGDPQETEELINLTQLTAQGLAELSAEALQASTRTPGTRRSERVRQLGPSGAGTLTRPAPTS